MAGKRADINLGDVSAGAATLTGSNLELVQKLYAAFAARDLPAILASLAPDVQWSEPENPWNPCGGTRHGHEGFLEWAMTGQASEEVIEMRPARFLASDDAVAVVGRTRCRARATGKTYETDFVHLITIDGAKVTRFQEFFDTYAAAEAFRQ